MPKGHVGREEGFGEEEGGERERFMLYGGALKAHLEAISVITITNV